jgi:hypothetical protein
MQGSKANYNRILVRNLPWMAQFCLATGSKKAGQMALGHLTGFFTAK